MQSGLRTTEMDDSLSPTIAINKCGIKAHKTN